MNPHFQVFGEAWNASQTESNFGLIVKSRLAGHKSYLFFSFSVIVESW